MKELLTYYSTRLVMLAVAVVMFALAVEEAVPWLFPNIHSNIQRALEYLNHRVAIVFYMWLGEYLLRTKLWRIEKKELDFSGIWEATTTYTKEHIGFSTLPPSNQHEVNIVQDCLSIRIAPTTSTGFVNWGSLALEVAEGDTLRYAYWVNYSQSNLFPERAKGYEEMKVTKRDEKGRPILMTGEFFHCVQGLGPVYSGTVEFRRKSGIRP